MNPNRNGDIFPRDIAERTGQNDPRTQAVFAALAALRKALDARHATDKVGEDLLFYSDDITFVYRRGIDGAIEGTVRTPGFVPKPDPRLVTLVTIEAILADPSAFTEILVGPPAYDPEARYFRVGGTTTPEANFTLGRFGGRTDLGRVVVNRRHLDAALRHYGELPGIGLLRFRPSPLLVYLGTAVLRTTGATVVTEGAELWEGTDVHYGSALFVELSRGKTELA